MEVFFAFVICYFVLFRVVLCCALFCFVFVLRVCLGSLLTVVQLRDAHLRTTKELEIARKQNGTLKEEKKRLEVRMDASVQKWKMELESRVSEMEHLRNTLVSPEYDSDHFCSPFFASLFSILMCNVSARSCGSFDD